MNSATSLTPTALSWIREELDRLLDRLRLQVENIAASPNPGTVTHSGVADSTDELAHIFATLGIDGARQVGQAMDRVVRALGEESFGHREEAASTLMDAVIILPAYLDRLQAGHTDLPLLLLPLINRLRALAGQDPLTEGTLFTPLLDVELPELEFVRKPGYDEPFTYFMARLHRQFEKALQNWQQDPEQPELLSAMQGIAETMRHRVQRYDLKRLWWVATEVIGGLLEGAIGNDIHLRRLLARLSLLIRNMAEGGEDGIDERVSTSVTQALLYHVLNARPGCAGVDLVRERFQLDELAPDSEAMMHARGTLSGQDRDMYRSLSAAVEDELAIVKDALDLELRTGIADPDQRRHSVEALARIGDTLGMLGLSGPGEAVSALVPAFVEAAGADKAERESALMGLAEQLLLVESALEEQIDTLGEPMPGESEETLIPLSGHEMHRIACAALDECVTDLHATQDAVRQRLEGQPDANPFEPLRRVAGALQLLGDVDAAAETLALEQCSRAMLDSARREEELQPERLDIMAEGMAALELYLAARRDHQHDARRFLDIVVERVRRLEAPPEAEAPEAPATREPVPAPPAYDGERETATGHAGATAAAMTPPQPPATEAVPDSPAETEPVPETAQAPDSAPETGGQPAATPDTALPPIDGEDALPPPVDPELRDIFLEEYEAVLESLQGAIPDWMNDLENAEALTQIRRAFHTLKGSGRMVGAEELGEFSWRIEDMLNALLEGRVENFADISVMVRLAQASLPALRQRMLQERAGLTSGLIALLGASAKTLAEGEAADWRTLRESLPVYLAGLVPGGIRKRRDEADAGPGGEDDLRQALAAALEPLREYLDVTARDRSARAGAEQVAAARNAAAMLAAEPEGRDADIARALGELLEAQSRSGQAFTPDALFTLISAVGELQNRLDRLSGEGEFSDAEVQEDLHTQLERLARQFASMPEVIDVHSPAEQRSGEEFDPGRSVFAPADQAPTEPDAGERAAPPGETIPEPAVGPEPTAEPAQPEIPADETPAREVPAPVTEDAHAAEASERTRAPVADPSPAELDPEITGIFLEEAREVLERADEALNSWRDDLRQLSWVHNLQREIHTFKGGARMAGLASMGEYSHEMETLLERIANGVLPPTVAAVQVLETACDRLQGWVELVAQRQVPDANRALNLLAEQIQALQRAPAGAEPPDLPMEPAPERVPQELPEPAPEATEPAPATADDTAGSHQIRVDADLLDKLVNAAGEVSIFRSRIEQQVSNLRGNLGEFDKTVDRLREQFRRLEIEIETQIRSNYADSPEQRDENFDPLELDQFSRLQQLSRSLSETVSDVLSLQEMLEESARNSEQLLLRQSRVSTELQEGLMRTRMVPFGSIASRLRRIVRGAAKETGKLARLQLRAVGSSDELDRNVLEHITAPLEHMMRNALVHGIEAPEQRRAAGKPEEGEITITVESEATEFVIRIADDGAGIDTEAIRARAVERGLLQPEDEPSRQRLYDFMMNSGFSTSSEVTRLAGRGVGMDVVSSEIKQIGGSLEIDSERGVGSQFTIRIPFTLAIMQAIGLLAGGTRYLLPLSSVMGVSRVEPEAYRELVAAEDPVYRFAGQEFPVLDMEMVLGERATPLGRDPVSLLILSAGEQKAALRVPELLPHREVVIKPVGPQISSIPGILGGAISGSGDVIVILDPGPLIRQALVHGVSANVAPEAAQGGPARKLIMVVDDSITMRKVTRRVLENHDFDVITAKDGVDALEQLQENMPDLMLCDIEMPRMDGYELTERVREDARLRHIPIMMITSRAGQKHRDRAAQAGANAYMTKPYREDDLIGQAFVLIDQARSAARGN